VQFGASQNAVVVSPEYRLLPEASGTDILDDMEQFWDWVHKSLPSVLSERWPGLSLDLNRVAAAGESAGGYLALQSAALFPAANIKLVMAQYCAIDLENPAYSPPGPVPSADDPLDEYKKALKPGSVRLSSPFPEKWQLTKAILDSGRHREVIGPDERMNLRRNIRQARKLPPMWIAQGMHDAMVSFAIYLSPYFLRCVKYVGVVDCSMLTFSPWAKMAKHIVDGLVAYIRETHPGTPLHYSVQPGNHGFDVSHTLEEPWVVEGAEFARKYW
jgi:acetyl esterase/lipase